MPPNVPNVVRSKLGKASNGLARSIGSGHAQPASQPQLQQNRQDGQRLCTALGSTDNPGTSNCLARLARLATTTTANFGSIP